MPLASAVYASSKRSGNASSISSFGLFPPSNVVFFSSLLYHREVWLLAKVGLGPLPDLMPTSLWFISYDKVWMSSPFALLSSSSQHELGQFFADRLDAII
ncbi:hypothetical protein GUJ93_ZPchr0002g25066 [Zizania palustris]|uniref:Uncharacterized protein n=1 Tax=Zizania palustris TaxID=103762 RepID=A0A8J5RIP1_ZIZPA|nr:hypothetical protein GUJ93_ZPchr0002g25066 [Zizania palustris]